MKPQRIILVRHGESQGNAEPENYASIPDYALKLTDKGNEQAVDAGRKIAEIIHDGYFRAYVSPWHRSRETYAGIASVLKERIVRSLEDPRIREQDWGHLQTVENLERINQERNNYSPFYYRLPDGESGADVYDRVSTFLEPLHRDFEKSDFPENALIVTHGMTLRIFLMRWFHWSVEFFESIRNPSNGEVFVMERGDDNRYHLVTDLRLRK